jgi:hypothetical protein
LRDIAVVGKLRCAYVGWLAPFVTHDHSGNNWWVAYLTFGEGWDTNGFGSASRPFFARGFIAAAVSSRRSL